MHNADLRCCEREFVISEFVMSAWAAPGSRGMAAHDGSGRAVIRAGERRTGPGGPGRYRSGAGQPLTSGPARVRLIRRMTRRSRSIAAR